MNKLQDLSQIMAQNDGGNSRAKAWWVPWRDQCGTDLPHVFISPQSRYTIVFYRILTEQKKITFHAALFVTSYFEQFWLFNVTIFIIFCSIGKC